MASDRATLKAQERTEFGSRTSRRLRRAGLVPGVVYGGGSEARAFQVNEREARNVLVHGGALIEVQIDGGQAVPVVVKEQQRGPVRGELLHLDTDEAPGVKEGGVMEHVTHEITISALPTAIPESIPADVSGMEIGDTLQLDGVLAPEGVEFVLPEGQNAEEVTIATLSPPRIEEEPEPEVEEEAELVGEGEVPEGEEAPAPEGEEPEEPAESDEDQE